MRKFYVLLIAVLFAIATQAQIGVTVTGNTNTTPNLSASYTSLANALTDLNAVTAMTGPVTLTLAAGASETAPATGLTIGSATLNPVLSATNTVNIIKAAGPATVLNAGVGTSTPGSAAPDGILKLSGADYITIDGITFTDGNAANPATMEFGIALFKASASDGCNYNTIQNCIFNMQRINNAGGTAPMQDGAIGILVINSTAIAATTSLTPTNGGTLPTNGTNSNNRIYGNTINGGNTGIGFSGYAASSGVGPAPVATTFLGDLNNDIGGNSAGTGNTILNYGGGGTTSPAAGIRANNQWSVNISYNNINNNDGAGTNHGTTLRGIYAQAGTSANATINNNTVTIKCAATTSASSAIENAIGSTAASNTISISNNTIQNCTYTTATSGTFTAILTSATATNVNVNSNLIQNNAVGNTGTAGSCVFQGIYCSGSAVNFTANSNTVTGNTANNSYGTMYCIRASSSTLSYDGNTITNNGFPNNSAATSVSLYGFYDGSSPVNESYTNNNINNLYITGNSTATGHVIYGIYNLTAAGIKIFTGNNINNLAFTSSGTGYASVVGIRNAYTTTSTIAKNVIHTLSSTGASPTVAGIYLGSSVGTTYNVYNNLIGNLTTPQSTGLTLYGIFCGSTGSNINLSFNTVYLNGTSSGTNFASAAVYMSSTTPTVTMLNNILINLSTPTGTGLSAVVRRTATALTSYGSTSNNNQFYAGTPSASKLLYYDGTNSYQTMAAYKTAVTPRESASFSEAVSTTPGVYFQSFTGPATGLSTTFLHMVNGLATQVESGGIPVTGITDDYDGNTRNVSTPDVGADEFNGVAVDLNGPAISYTNLGNTLCTSNRTLSATITDASGVNTAAGTKPRIYFKKSTNTNGLGATNDNTTDGWKYTEATNASSPFSFTIDYTLVFGGVAAGETVQYFVVAQDLVGTPNISINSGTFAAAPTSVNLTAAAFPLTGTINSYNVLAGGLSGVVTIGAAGTYPTLTGTGGLFAALNAGGLTGNLTANLIDASITEPGTNALNNIQQGCAGPYTLTIKPTATTTITGSVGTGAVIKLNGADYVTIDGSNSGGTDRSLTIQNTTTTTSGNAVVWLASPALSDGASNNTIKNCIIEGNAATTTFLGVYQGGSSTISLTAAGAENNNNNTYNNNLFRKTQYGLALFGYLAASPDLNNSITNNNFGTAVAGEGFALAGINSDRQNSLIVSGNEVQNITNATTASNVFGIRLLDFKNGLAFNNKVHDMVYTGTTTPKYYGIAVTSSTYTTAGNPSNAQVYNNIVYNIFSTGTSAVWNTTGILASAGYGDKFYYNSVNLTGQLANSSSGLVAAFANGDGNISTVCTNIDVRNNIFSLTGSSGTAGGNFYAYYTAATTLTGSTLNYNDLYCAGTNATNNVGRFNAVAYTTLAAWQAATGQEANSIAANPNYNSATNLIPSPGSPVLNAATPIAGITTDILGNPRSASTPTMGAYEISGDFTGPVITYTLLDNTLCNSNRTIVATITDASGINVAAGTKPRIYFKKSTNANTYVDNTSATNGWKYAEASNASSPFNLTIDYSLVFGGVAAGETVQYFVVAQDLAAIPNVSINSGTFATAPASVALSAANFPLTGTINSYTIPAGGLSGTVTIGAAGTYPTLTGAGGLFAAINASGLTGNLTANILDASITETGANALNQMSYDCAGPYTLTIKPGAGVTSTLTGSLTSNLVRILSSNVVIDGSNNGTTSRNLTITNTSATTPGVMLIGSTGTISVNNVTVKNCILINGANTNTALIVSDGTVSGNPGYFTNITIQNNSVQKAYVGVYAIAVVTPGNGSGMVMSGNDLNTSGANSIRLIGLYLQGIDGATVSNNNIGNIANTTESSNITGIWLATSTINTTVSGNVIVGMSGTSAGPRGIAISTAVAGANINVTGNTLNNLTSNNSGTTTGIYLFSTSGGVTIQKNNISNIKNTSTTGWGSNGIWLSSTLTTAAANVYNNYISDVASYGYLSGASVSDNGYGIILTSGGGYNVYYNTVVMNTSQTVTGLPAAINIYSGVTTPASVNILDNIFYNSQTVGTDRYAIYCSAAASVFGSINNNDYYTSGPSFGFLGSNIATLAGWQTATAGDLQSQNIAPVFVSASDFHLSSAIGANWCLNGKGVNIPGITTDYDGDSRSNPPDIGADEFIATGATVATPSSQTICSGATITTIALSGTGTSYNWTRDNTGSVTGIAASGSGDISGSLTNTTSAPITVTFTITPVISGCNGPSITATVLVNPTPDVVATPSSQTICSGSAITTIALSSSVSGTTYSWTRDNTGSVTGIAASGSGNISGSLTNTTSAPVTVTFTITPSASGCPGTPITATVLVNPTPDAAATPSSQTICSGSAITTIALSSSVSGATFTWTRNNTGTVTGIAASGSGDISGSLTNTTNAPITVTFTITPSASGCPGAPITATVLVNPTPDAVATPSSQTICSGNSITTIILSGSVSGTTYSWTRDNTGTVTGIAASGSGNISGALTNTTASPVTVTFTITPSASGCPGTPITATVTVNPLPTINAVVVQPTTCVSNDGSIDITVSGTPGPYSYSWSTSGGSGLVPTAEDQTGLSVGQYTVLVTDQTTGCQQTAVYNLIGPGGCSICPTMGALTTTPATNTCVNSNVTLDVTGLTFMGVTYGVTFKYFAAPTANPYSGGTVIATVPNGSLGGGGTTATANTSFAVAGNYYIYAIITPTPIDPTCRPSVSTMLTVNPNPTVNPIASQTYCNGTVVPTGTFNFTSPTTGSFNGKILIAYADNSGAPTQLQTALQALPGVTQVDLFDALAGTPSLALMQTYGIVVPFSNSPFNDPVALGDNLADYVDANGVAVPIGFSFYTSPYTPTGRWATGNYSPYVSTTNLDFTNRTLGTYNAGHPLMAGVSAMASNYHNVVPLAAGVTEVAQWDNGESLVAFKGRVVGITAYIGTVATWSGDFAKVIVNAGTWLGGGSISFSWTNNNTAIGLGASGTGTSLPTFTATNVTNAPITATISVVATLTNGSANCSGPATTFNITVNPTPNAVATPASQTICSANPITTIVLSSAVSGTTYAWTRDNTGTVTGIAASGSGDISGTLTNTTNAPITVTFTITPTANGCPGTPITATVLVNPTPDAVATPASQTICSASAITTIVLSGNVAGTTYTWTRNNTGTVTGIAASGSGNISGTLTNTTNAPITVTFTITPSANGCSGTPITATVLVNPTPNAVATPSTQTVCSGSPMTTIVLSGSVAGTTFNWTRDNTVNITGIPNSGSGNISGTPINNTAVQQVVTFTITPIANGCPGTPITATLIVNKAPTITCPANITVNNTLNQCGAIVNYPPATATGSPAPVITYSQASGTFFPVGTTTVTCTATNICGTATCTFTITVVDAQAPTITCPANITVNNAPGVCGANVTYPFPTVGDNCTLPGGTPVTLSQTTNNTTITPIQIGCQYAGGVTAANSWWRAYDLAPQNLPAGITIRSVRFGIEKITGTTVPITARIYTSAGPFPASARTLLATQTANFAPQTGTFGVINFTTPAVVPPNAIVVVELFCPDQLATGAGFFIGSNGLGESAPSYLSATACGVANPTPIADLVAVTDHIILNINAEYYTSAPTLVQIAGLPSGGLFPVGTTTNTFRATDAAGNTSTCSFTVTVLDAQAPTITCPANIVRNTDPGVCTASIAVPNPTFSDNCAVTQLTWAMTGATVASSPATGINFVGTRTFNLNGTTGQGVTTVTYTAKDAAGNTSTCSFTVTVNDAVQPIISAQPATRFTCVGSNAVFSVTAAANGGPLAYQWQEWNGTAWVNIAGATANSFTVANVSFADNTRSFRVILTGLCTVVNSSAATLYVNPLPTVQLVPTIPPILTPGQSLTINAVASPAGGSYAWYFNGVLVPGRTASSWTGITVDGIGTYRVIYTDPNGCTGTSADLVVTGQQSGGLWVYPNPNTGRFLVRFYNAPNESITINVYDAKGARIFQKVAATGTAYTGIDVDLGTQVAAGVYIVTVVDSSGKIIGSRRIVVRHP